MRSTTPTYRLLAALLVAAIAGLGGCAMDSAPHYQNDTGPDHPELQNASVHLADHEIREARRTYAELVADETVEDRVRARASAGMGIANLLLLPGSDPVDSFVQEHLGATGELDAQNAIYADEGYLYWRAQGARWERSGDSADIKQLIADRVPWEESQLDSLAAFTKGLDAPFGQSRDQLLQIAERLGEIREDFRVALDNRQFKRVIVPGETFRDVQLTLRLGKSELAGISAVIEAVRGAVFYALAYKYDWSLADAFNHPKESFDGDGGSGWERWDYTLKYLDAHWFRRRANLDRALFQRSRELFENALGLARESITFGLENRNDSVETTLDWDKVDAEYARDWKRFLAAVEDALDNPTALPFTEHPTDETRLRANFTLLFDSGRILGDPAIEWLVASETTSRDNPAWVLGDRALQSFFVEGIFEPPFDLTNGEKPSLANDFGGERLEDFLGRLFDTWLGAFEKSYLSN